MHDILTYILLMVVLSFVATCLLVGFHWSFRRRKIQEYQPTDDDEVVSTEEVYQSEPFRWYYVFIIILGVLLALWLLPVLAGTPSTQLDMVRIQLLDGTSRLM